MPSADICSGIARKQRGTAKIFAVISLAILPRPRISAAEREPLADNFMEEQRKTATTSPRARRRA
jgi:hypothetical protein